MKSLILSLVLCINCCIDPVLNSFVDAYTMYMEKHYHKFHELAERYSIDSINASDSLIFIPLLTIRRKIENNWEWNINASVKNKINASWNNLDYKQRRPKEFILCANNQCVRLYNNMGIGRKIIYDVFNNPVAEKLIEMVTQFEPDGIFMVHNIPGWFFIIGENISYIELKNQDLFFHEDASAWLKSFFIQPDFIPVFSGQSL